MSKSGIQRTDFINNSHMEKDISISLPKAVGWLVNMRRFRIHAVDFNDLEIFSFLQSFPTSKLYIESAVVEAW